MLRRHNIKFQTAFMAKLGVFYEDGTHLYETVKDAMMDINNRGMPVTMITRKESWAGQLSATAWRIVRTQQSETSFNPSGDKAVLNQRSCKVSNKSVKIKRVRQISNILFLASVSFIPPV